VPSLAPHVRTLPASAIRRVTELAWRTPGAIVLSVGEPDLPTAPHILAAAHDALRRDDTRYTPNGGIEPLRVALAHRLKRDHGVDVTPDQVWVTAGGTQALHLALSLTVAAGDEVLVPDPGYPAFGMAAHLVQAVPVSYRLSAERGFLPDPATIEAAITPRTRMLLLNSPSNPLGTAFPAELLAELVDLARRHDLWVLSDECYEAFTYDEPHHAAAAYDTDGRVLTLHTFSKTYAMTGMRVGALVVPPDIIDVLPSAQESVVSCVNTPAQYAALAALTGPQDAVVDAARTYRANRDLVGRLLDERGIDYLRTGGGLYLWADVSHLSNGDVEQWTVDLVTTEAVALAPGSAFGSAGEGWVRICLASSAADLVAGVSRLPGR
jgi:aspartate aminotransferase